MAQYADELYCNVDGVPVEIKSVRKTGSFAKHEPVKTMNPTGRPLGKRKTMGEVTITLEVPVRAGLPDFEALEASTLAFTQRVGGTPNYIATGVFFQDSEVGTDAESGEQVLSITLGCLDWRKVG
jgi:hypothetical protein